jgi:hypothetical protein
MPHRKGRSRQNKNWLVTAFVFDPALFTPALVLYPVLDIAIHDVPPFQPYKYNLNHYTTPNPKEQIGSRVL